MPEDRLSGRQRKNSRKSNIEKINHSSNGCMNPVVIMDPSIDSPGSENLVDSYPSSPGKNEEHTNEMCAFCNCGSEMTLILGQLTRYRVSQSTLKKYDKFRSEYAKEEAEISSTDVIKKSKVFSKRRRRRNNFEEECNLSPDMTAFGTATVQAFVDVLDGDGCLWTHHCCAAWSAGVCQTDSYDLENVDRAVAKALVKKCSHCERFGASVECQVQKCTKLYHYPCCASAGAFQNITSMILLCPLHLDRSEKLVDAEAFCDTCEKSDNMRSQLFCTSCGRHFHSYCVDMNIPITPVVRMGWQCSFCKVCQGCKQPGDEEKMLCCDQCDKGYHTYCLNPPITAVPKSVWKCISCRKCSDCGSTRPGSGPSCRWHNNYSLCDRCYQQRKKGQCCPVCKRAMRLFNNVDAVQCISCYKCVHGECLQEDVVGDYVCPECDITDLDNNMDSYDDELLATGQKIVTIEEAELFSLAAAADFIAKCEKTVAIPAEDVKPALSDDEWVRSERGSESMVDSPYNSNQFLDSPAPVCRARGRGAIKTMFKKSLRGNRRFRGNPYRRSTRQSQDPERKENGESTDMADSFSRGNNNDDDDGITGLHSTVVIASTRDSYTLKQDICMCCGSLGSGDEGYLIGCVQCGQCFHPYCVNVQINEVILRRGWRCIDCSVCEGCGRNADEAHLLLCDVCDISFHTYCLNPPLEEVPIGGWKCHWCVVCEDCGTKESGVNSLWMANYTQCGPCASQNFCFLCLYPYEPNNLIIQCENCNRWLHGDCDGLCTEEDADLACSLTYHCLRCRQVTKHLGIYTSHKNSQISKINARKALYGQNYVQRKTKSLAAIKAKKLTRSEIKEQKRIELESMPLVPADAAKDEFGTVEMDFAHLKTRLRNSDTSERTSFHLTEVGLKEIKQQVIRAPIHKTGVRKDRRKREDTKNLSIMSEEVSCSLDQEEFNSTLEAPFDLEPLTGDGGLLSPDMLTAKQEDIEELMQPDTTQEDFPNTDTTENEQELVDVTDPFEFFGVNLLERHLHMELESQETSTNRKKLKKERKRERRMRRAAKLAELDPLLSGPCVPDPTAIILPTQPPPDAPTATIEALVDLITPEAPPAEAVTKIMSKQPVLPDSQPGVDQPPPQSPQMPVDIKSEVESTVTRAGQMTEEVVNSSLDVPSADQTTDNHFELMHVLDLPHVAGHEVENLFAGLEREMGLGAHKFGKMPAKPSSVVGEMVGMMHDRPVIPGMPVHPPNMDHQMKYPQSMMMVSGNNKGIPPAQAAGMIPQFPPTGADDFGAAAGGAAGKKDPTKIDTQKQMRKWELDEQLGDDATISPVLYTNTMHKNLKIEYPDWPSRARAVARLWRKLPNDQREPFRIRARDNRIKVKERKSTSRKGGSQVQNSPQQQAKGFNTPQLPQQQLHTQELLSPGGQQRKPDLFPSSSFSSKEDPLSSPKFSTTSSSVPMSPIEPLTGATTSPAISTIDAQKLTSPLVQNTFSPEYSSLSEMPPASPHTPFFNPKKPFKPKIPRSKQSTPAKASEKNVIMTVEKEKHWNSSMQTVHTKDDRTGKSELAPFANQEILNSTPIKSTASSVIKSSAVSTIVSVQSSTTDSSTKNSEAKDAKNTPTKPGEMDNFMNRSMDQYQMRSVEQQQYMLNQKYMIAQQQYIQLQLAQQSGMDPMQYNVPPPTQKDKDMSEVGSEQEHQERLRYMYQQRQQATFKDSAFMGQQPPGGKIPPDEHFDPLHGQMSPGMAGRGGASYPRVPIFPLTNPAEVAAYHEMVVEHMQQYRKRLEMDQTGPPLSQVHSAMMAEFAKQYHQRQYNKFLQQQAQYAPYGIPPEYQNYDDRGMYPNLPLGKPPDFHPGYGRPPVSTAMPSKPAEEEKSRGGYSSSSTLQRSSSFQISRIAADSTSNDEFLPAKDSQTSEIPSRSGENNENEISSSAKIDVAETTSNTATSSSNNTQQQMDEEAELLKRGSVTTTKTTKMTSGRQRNDVGMDDEESLLGRGFVCCESDASIDSEEEFFTASTKTRVCSDRNPTEEKQSARSSIEKESLDKNKMYSNAEHEAMFNQIHSTSELFPKQQRQPEMKDGYYDKFDQYPASSQYNPSYHQQPHHPYSQYPTHPSYNLPGAGYPSYPPANDPLKQRHSQHVSTIKGESIPDWAAYLSSVKNYPGRQSSYEQLLANESQPSKAPSNTPAFPTEKPKLPSQSSFGSKQADSSRPLHPSQRNEKQKQLAMKGNASPQPSQSPFRQQSQSPLHPPPSPFAKHPDHRQSTTQATSPFSKVPKSPFQTPHSSPSPYQIQSSESSKPHAQQSPLHTQTPIESSKMNYQTTSSSNEAMRSHQTPYTIQAMGEIPKSHIVSNPNQPSEGAKPATCSSDNNVVSLSAVIKGAPTPAIVSETPTSASPHKPLHSSASSSSETSVITTSSVSAQIQPQPPPVSQNNNMLRNMPPQTSQHVTTPTNMPPSSGTMPSSSGAIPPSSGTMPMPGGAIPASSGAIPLSSGTMPLSGGAIPPSSSTMPIPGGALPMPSGTIPPPGGAIPPSAGANPPTGGAIPGAAKGSANNMTSLQPGSPRYHQIFMFQHQLLIMQFQQYQFQLQLQFQQLNQQQMTHQQQAMLQQQYNQQIVLLQQHLMQQQTQLQHMAANGIQFSDAQLHGMYEQHMGTQRSYQQWLAALTPDQQVHLTQRMHTRMQQVQHQMAQNMQQRARKEEEQKKKPSKPRRSLNKKKSGSNATPAVVTSSEPTKFPVPELSDDLKLRTAQQQHTTTQTTTTTTTQPSVMATSAPSVIVSSSAPPPEPPHPTTIMASKQDTHPAKPEKISGSMISPQFEEIQKSFIIHQKKIRGEIPSGPKDFSGTFTRNNSELPKTTSAKSELSPASMHQKAEQLLNPRNNGMQTHLFVPTHPSQLLKQANQKAPPVQSPPHQTNATLPKGEVPSFGSRPAANDMGVPTPFVPPKDGVKDKNDLFSVNQLLSSGAAQNNYHQFMAPSQSAFPGPKDQVTSLTVKTPTGKGSELLFANTSQKLEMSLADLELQKNFMMNQQGAKKKEKVQDEKKKLKEQEKIRKREEKEKLKILREQQKAEKIQQRIQKQKSIQEAKAQQLAVKRKKVVPPLAIPDMPAGAKPQRSPVSSLTAKSPPLFVPPKIPLCEPDVSLTCPLVQPFGFNNKTTFELEGSFGCASLEDFDNPYREKPVTPSPVDSTDLLQATSTCSVVVTDILSDVDLFPCPPETSTALINNDIEDKEKIDKKEANEGVGKDDATNLITRCNLCYNQLSDAIYYVDKAMETVTECMLDKFELMSSEQLAFCSNDCVESFQRKVDVTSGAYLDEDQEVIDAVKIATMVTVDASRIFPPLPDDRGDAYSNGAAKMSFANKQWKRWHGTHEPRKKSFKPNPSRDELKEMMRKYSVALKPSESIRDRRTCSLCRQTGDGDGIYTARLINCDVDVWVHLNCALWSNEVYESLNGSMHNVDKALDRAKQIKCSHCGKPGATLNCTHSFGPQQRLHCEKVFHFPCALQSNCSLYKDKTVLCNDHKSFGSRKEELNCFAVRRKVYVERNITEQIASMLRLNNDLERKEYTFRVGNLIFHELGHVPSHLLDSFSNKDYVFPVDFETTSIFWDHHSPFKRRYYTCSISERLKSPRFKVKAHANGSAGAQYTNINTKGAWDEIMKCIQKMRESEGSLKVFPEYVCGEDLFGLSEPTIQRMIESLPGIDTIANYNFRFGRTPILIAELPLALNPTGCIRSEASRKHHAKPLAMRKPSEHSPTTTEPSGDETWLLYNTQRNALLGTKSGQYRRMRQEWRNNVVLGRSRIQGLGLFTKKDIEENTFLIEYIGSLIRNEVANRLEQLYERQNRGIYMFRTDSDTVVDATMAGGPARYINHSCDPNCVAEIVTIEREKKIIIISNRKIAKGEELTYDYKFELEDDSEKIACLCSSSNCRKWMN